MASKRGAKKHHHSGDLFALGSSTSAPGPQSKLAKRSENLPTSISSISNLRPKINSPLHSQSTSSPHAIVPQQTKQSWEEKAICVAAVELEAKILDLDSQSLSDSEEMIERLLCGAAKQLREQKTKPDSCLVFTLIYLAKIRPLFFCSNIIVDAFSSLLKREHLIHFKSKNNMVPVLIINLFYYAFHDENSWPELFINLYVEDSLGDRIWVDNEECKEFVKTILGSFHTKLPPKSLLHTSDVSNPSAKQQLESSPSLTLTSSVGEDSVGEESCSSTGISSLYEHQRDGNRQSTVQSRYLENEEAIFNYVYDTILENLNRRLTANDVSRNMLKLLMATSGLRKVRSLTAQKLELWLQNPKLSRPAQDLLLTTFINCDDKDYDTLSFLLKMRLKNNKHLFPHFTTCFQELLKQKNGTFEIALGILLSNELLGIRNLNNIQLLLIMFQQSSIDATTAMAEHYSSLIVSREDIRIFNLLRELARSMKTERFDFELFTKCLLQKNLQLFEKQLINEEFQKERIVETTLQIIMNLIFLSVIYGTREPTIRPDRRELLRNVQKKIAKIHYEAVNWIEIMASHHYHFNNIEHSLRRILILDLKEIKMVESWSMENERIIFERTSEGIPVKEKTVQIIFKMVFNPKINLPSTDACEIVCELIDRATKNFDGDFNNPVLKFRDVEIVNTLFRCCVYNYPPDVQIRFPNNYVKPELAQGDLYWKVWLRLVVIAAHIPSIFGEWAWKNFPTFQALIEMAVTNNFQFPPLSMDTNEIQNEIQNYNQAEKIKILEFEAIFFGVQEVNENNSYFIKNRYIIFDPSSIPRRPSDITDSIMKEFIAMCTNQRLCNLLCQSRDPDFLLKIMDKQRNISSASSSTWLVELVESYEANYGLLPIRCLCEFFLKQLAEEELSSHFSENIKSERVRKRRKLIRLIHFLQSEIQQATSEKLSDTLQYLFSCLSHVSSSTRLNAYRALQLIVLFDAENYMQQNLDQDTLIDSPLLDEQATNKFQENLVKYLKYPSHIQAICTSLNDALSEETNIEVICKYLELISYFQSEVSETTALKLSNLLIDRKKIATHIVKYTNNHLKSIFLSSLYTIYAVCLRSIFSKKAPISNNQSEYLLVRFNDRPFVYIHSNIIYGAIISLSFIDTPSICQNSRFLADLFFNPIEIKEYSLESKTKFVKSSLVPAWLVKRLLSSNSDKIIALAISNIEEQDAINYIQSFGVSTNACQKILEKLDILSNKDDMINKINFDSEKLLTHLQLHWSNGIACGQKFAKKYLDYSKSKKEVKNKDVEMVSQSTCKSSKTDTKSTDISDDLENSRKITSELMNPNLRNKKNTMEFLNFVLRSLKSKKKNELKKTVSSQLNIIIAFAMKDPCFPGIKSLLIDISKVIHNSEIYEDTSKSFKRFLAKEEIVETKMKTKTKKITPQESPDDDIKPSNRSNDFDSLSNTIQNLAIEEAYQKDLNSENFNVDLKKAIFSRNTLHFLSILLDKSNYSTLNSCIDFILNDEKSYKKLNPTTILEFLTICIDSPRLWAGRDNDSQKELIHENILNLSPKEMKKLITYVIMEKNVSKRIDLILRTCFLDIRKSKEILKFLEEQCDDKEMLDELLTRLYLRIPAIGLNLDRVTSQQIIFTQTLPCTLDKIAHNLITFFDQKNIDAQIFNFLRLSLINLAAKHPLLIMRQLPLLSELLSTKISVKYDVFKSLNSLNVLYIVLKILELSSPYIWNRNVKGIEDILNVYMDTFMVYHRIPQSNQVNLEILPIIIQFLYLIDDWSKNDFQLSNEWKQQHRDQLMKLSQAYSDTYHTNEQNLFNIVNSILSGFPLQDQMSLIVETPLYQSYLSTIKMPELKSDILGPTLIEINKLIDKYPLLGEHFLYSLQSHYFNLTFCELALAITMKILQAQPKLCKSIIPSYLRCLESPSTNIVKNALDILPQFIILAQEYRCLILGKVFQLAVHSNTHAVRQLSASFKALNLQRGS